MDEPSWLDFSSGGVPASKIFELILDDLKEIASNAEQSDVRNTQCEICFIGLISYFEAFCKDLFSSVINIAPSILLELKKSGLDVSTDLTKVALYKSGIEYKLGFLVSENYDFGSAKKINSLYGALLNISPFSKTEAAVFDSMLRDRNLIVHHGGIYTLQYLEQSKIIDKDPTENAYFHSLVLNANDVMEKIRFVEVLARKMSNSTKQGLSSYCERNRIELGIEQSKAIEHMGWDREHR